MRLPDHTEVDRKILGMKGEFMMPDIMLLFPMEGYWEVTSMKRMIMRRLSILWNRGRIVCVGREKSPYGNSYRIWKVVA